MFSVSRDDRILYVDLFRSIGIILMIMGHIGFGLAFDHIIHAFHMPMFFFASGWFYKQEHLKRGFDYSRIIKLFKSLLIPYLSFALFHWLVAFILHEKVIWNRIVMNTCGSGINIAGALWFLTAIFFTQIIYLMLNKLLNNIVLVTISVFILALLGNSFQFMCQLIPPLGLDAALVGLGFYHLGRMFKKLDLKDHKLMNLSIVEATLLGCIGIISAYYSGYVNMRTGNYSFIPLFWMNSILIITALWNICKILNVGLNKTKVYKYITNIGKDSMVYLCLNQLIIRFLVFLLQYFIIDHYLLKILTLMGTLGTLEICRRIFTKTRLRVFIGK